MFQPTVRSFTFAIATAAFGLSAATADVVLAPGTYQLRNHPDGAEAPPFYGARYDELYNATSGHDIFTLDFNDSRSNVTMTITATTIRIVGNAWGGRDNGSGFAADSYRGLYHVDFLYNLGVSQTPGDNDIWVNTANYANHGFIDTPLGDKINLVDERGSFGFSLRIGNEDNDLGHRGYNGISGWGWQSYSTANGITHAVSTDWLFTVVVPAPSAAAFLGLGALAAGRRRR